MPPEETKDQESAEGLAGGGLSAKRAAVVLLVLTALAYCITFRAELFWDDHIVIRPDRPIASLLTIPRAFTRRCALFPEGYNYPYYRPLVDISFVLEYQIGGTHPLVYHMTNYTLHLANVLLAFGLFLRLLRGGANGAADRGRLVTAAAFIGAGLFALHPLQCESVLWPAARPAVMCVFFGQLGAWAALKFLSGDPESVYAARKTLLFTGASAGFVAALLSKEVAVPFVPAAAVFFFTKGRRPPARAFLLFGVLLVILVSYLILNRFEVHHVGGVLSSRLLGLLDVLISALGFYTRQLMFPLVMAPYYAPGTSASPVYYALGVAAIGVIACVSALLMVRRARPAMAALFGLVIFMSGAWLPLLGGQAILADRYLYQAMWGLGLALAAGLAQTARRFSLPQNRVFPACLLVLCLLAALSLRQSAYWIRQDVLWARTLEIDPTNVHANVYLGGYFESRGDAGRAEACYRVAAFESLNARPGDRFNAAMALGHLLLSGKRYDEALASYGFAAQGAEFAQEALVCQAIVDYSRGAPDAARARLRSFEDDGRRKASTYLNLALLALRLDDDRQTAAAWYGKARARGAAPNTELERLVRSSPTSPDDKPGAPRP